MPGDHYPDLEHLADAIRRYHSAWLTHAMKRGVRPPRIPVRKVSEGGGGGGGGGGVGGGWTALMQTPEGRAWADEFWQGALAHPDAG